MLITDSLPVVTVHKRAICLLVASCLVVGCQEDVRPRERRAALSTAAQQSADESHFVIAMKLLDELDIGLFSGHETRGRISYHLQEWGKQQQANPDWFADPMLLRLPARYSNMANPKHLPSLRFFPADVTYLVESVMARDIARQVVARELNDDMLLSQLETQSSGLEANHRDQLLRAAKLFDWTVRNIQLQPLDPPVPAELPATAPPLPTPGARRFAWEAILTGQGDAMSRARVFMLLARQQRIPVVMLGIVAEPAPIAWCPAAWIGGQLYLFDAALGLPVPGPSGSGIATLQQLREQPEQLRQLDVSDGPKYPIEAADLQRLVALIDAVPEALSQRMTLVEAALAGDQKMVLTTQASLLANELQATSWVVRSEIWTQPYETQLFHLRALSHPETQLLLQSELQPLEGDQPLATARRLHLRGVYDNDPPRKGARAWYLAARPSNRELDASRELTDEQLQQEIAKRLNLPDEIRQNVGLLRQVVEISRRQAASSKQAASYWLGIIAFEHQQFDVAIDYFQTRTLEATPNGEWAPGARYQLARVYELLSIRHNDPAQRARAIELLRADPQTPQAHGNLIRAQRLTPPD